MEDDGESGHVDIPGLPESEQKGKKGKKKSNAKKTFTLQNFLQDQENVEPADNGTAVGAGSQSLAKLSLDDKESAVLESCHSFIHDLLKQLGPTNAMDPAIQQEINNFPPEAKAVMQKLGGYRKFILRCKDLVVVDKIVAARSDLAAAQEMAFKEIYSNIPSDVSISSHSRPEPKDIWTDAPPAAKVPMWNSTNISSSISSSQNHPLDSVYKDMRGGALPESPHLLTNSFNSQNQDSEFLRGGQNSSRQMLFGGLGSLVSQESAVHKNGDIKPSAQHFSSMNMFGQDNSVAQALEEYQARLWQQTSANNELLKRLAEKDNQLKDHHLLKQKLLDLDLEHKTTLLQLGQYKTEVDLLRLEVARLKQCGTAGLYQEDNAANGSGCTPRDVILHLQKQLEQELLKNRNLTQQLEVQHRGESLKLAAAESGPASLAPGSKLPRQNTFGGLSLSREDDLFGLRSMTMNSGPLADMSSLAPAPSAATAAAAHSVFGAFGSDFSSRLPLNKAVSAANLGFHMNLGDSREPSPADLQKNMSGFLGSFNPPLSGGSLGDQVSTGSGLAALTANSKSARQEQLVKKLVATIPGSTEDSIKHYIQVLREQHGKLSGWPTSRIAAEISQLMENQQ